METSCTCRIERTRQNRQRFGVLEATATDAGLAGEGPPRNQPSPQREAPARKETARAAPRTKEHAAPELGIATHTVVGVRAKRFAGRVEPGLICPVAKLLPNRLRIPILLLPRHKTAAFNHTHLNPSLREDVRQGPTASSTPDNDDVVASGRHLKLQQWRKDLAFVTTEPKTLAASLAPRKSAP